jgi:drug/metabolite transporter (DMT)-like permease
VSKGQSHRDVRDDETTVGWIEAAAFVVAVSMLNVLYAYAVAKGANVIVFVLYALIGASVAMLATSGIGRDAWAVITAPQSWVYGSASIALEAIYFLLVGLISPAEASLTARLSVPASILIGWWLFSSNIKLRQFVGGLIVIAAVVPLLAWPQKTGRWPSCSVCCARSPLRQRRLQASSIPGTGQRKAFRKRCVSRGW